MKVLIVDDESPARERLNRLISEMDGYEATAEAANGIEAISLYNQLRPEIVLLDIRMPAMDGLETAQHLALDTTPPAIIFTTAYGDHALEAFKIHAVDYLLKPVRKERLLDALSSAKRSNRAQLQGVDADSRKEESLGPRQHICARNRGNLELIPIDDVYYFRAEDKYVTLRHTSGETLIEDSLVSLEKEFSKIFLRVHRNALVATSKICGLEKNSDGSLAVKLIDLDDSVDVSRRHLATIRGFLKK